MAATSLDEFKKSLAPLQSKKTLRSKNTAELLVACRKHSWDKVAGLLNARADASAYGHHQISALMMAASHGQAAICDMLLAKKASVNHVDDLNGKTALMYGCSSSASSDWKEVGGGLDAIAVLLEGRADVNFRTVEAQTALMMAAAGGRRDVCYLLLEGKADVNLQASTSEVCHKTMNMSKQVVGTFFKGHDSNPMSNFLRYVRRLDEMEDQLSLAEGPESGSPDSPNANDYIMWNEQAGDEPLTPGYVMPEHQQDAWKHDISVDTTASAGFSTVSEEFSTSGDPSPKSQHFRSFDCNQAFSLASLDDWGRLSEEPPERRETGFTPERIYPDLFLSSVAPLRKKDLAKEPLTDEELQKVKQQAEGLRKMKRSHGGTSDTALTLAARQGHVNVCELLLVYQADVNMKDKSGDSAIEIAGREGHHEVCQILLRSNPSEEILRSALALSTAFGKEGAAAVLRGYEVLAA